MQNKIINFFFELSQLWYNKHNGWKLAGIEDPESIAEHVHRASQIAYVLAMEEGADPEKTVMITLFHDNGEARVLDAHRVTSRYFDTKAGEATAALEQFANLPEKSAKKIKQLYLEFEERKTLEAICAKDADYLEQAVRAREYLYRGYQDCQDWINNIKMALKTETAKKWILEIETANPNAWWYGLKKLPK